MYVSHLMSYAAELPLSRCDTCLPQCVDEGNLRSANNNICIQRYWALLQDWIPREWLFVLGGPSMVSAMGFPFTMGCRHRNCCHLCLKSYFKLLDTLIRRIKLDEFSHRHSTGGLCHFNSKSTVPALFECCRIGMTLQRLLIHNQGETPAF